MERIRLTQRMAARNRNADSAQPETPIDLGKNRTYREIDQYHTFEQTVNHELPDKRHEWKEDKHDETGFGVPKMAKVYMAAKKATKLAMMLLGENASEQSLESQARAFMRMGDRALTASIERWAECKGEGCEENNKNCGFNGDDEAEAPAEAEAPVEAPAEAEAPVEAPAEDAPVEEAPVAEAPAEGEGETEDVEVSDELADTSVDFDDAEDGADTGADKELEQVFEDDAEEEEAPAEQATTASKKSGLKKLAGQPMLVRVASKKADDLAGIWDKWENPDVR